MKNGLEWTAAHQLLEDQEFLYRIIVHDTIDPAFSILDSNKKLKNEIKFTLDEQHQNYEKVDDKIKKYSMSNYWKTFSKSENNDTWYYIFIEEHRKIGAYKHLYITKEK